jgi:hypothetical protein
MHELRIIAKRVDGAYIVAINDEDGFVVSEQGKVISPIMMYDAFIKFGYWNETDDDPGFDLNELFEEALKLTKSPKLK